MIFYGRKYLLGTAMKYQQTAVLLTDIELALKSLAMWHPSPPTADALASSAPFCCDTLHLSQWLQFIFLPRMRALIEVQLPLPANICICPIAEEAFAPLTAVKLPLINRIADLDELLSGRREQQSARS